MSTTKPFVAHFHPYGEWVLHRRIFQKEKKVQLLDSTKETTQHFVCQVIEVGPGEYQNGVFVKPPATLRPGVLFLTPAPHCIASIFWKGHDLYQCPASSITTLVDPCDELDLDFSLPEERAARAEFAASCRPMLVT
jgi:hypothetical protein